MIAIRPHTAQDYAQLPDIDDGDTGQLTEGDLACLEELGQFLVRLKAHERFGIVLLHSHFPFEDGEQLIQEFHHDLRETTLRPRRGVHHEVVPTTVLFEDDNGDVRLVGLEFLQPAALEAVAPISDADEEILVSLRDILDVNGKLGRFGVRLLNDPFHLEDSVLFETCNPDTRVLTCVPTTPAEMAGRNTTPTLFQWIPLTTDDGTWSTSQECPIHCVMGQACETVEFSDGSTKHRKGSLRQHTGMRDHD